MGEAPEPPEEMARLENLRSLKILDTDPEESFDRLARLATWIFDVPIAHVSLIDEQREWFKAKCGVEATEGPRNSAFCAHTILADELLLIEDTHEDERFRRNPQVMEIPGIRFYAGAPLVTSAGQAVGAFCIKDYRPRQLTEFESLILRTLARLVVAEMEHRIVEGELRKWEYIFSRAEWGIALADGDNSTLDMMNPAFAAMHGFTVAELTGRPIVDVFAPECRDQANEGARIVRERGHHIYETKHVRKDGTVFPVLMDAAAVRGRNGRLLYRVAHVQDITERKYFEEELHFKNTILETQQESSLDGILVVDHDGEIFTTNRRFVKMWGIPDDVLASRRDDLALQYVNDQLVDPKQFQARVRHLYEHRSETCSDEISLRDGRVLDRYSAPMQGPQGEYYGRVWYFRDITDRIRAERATRETEERLTRILESAMDAIVTIDEKRHITLFNAAAEDVFRCSAASVIGQSFDRFASVGFRELIDRCEKAFARKGSRKRYMWAPDGLTALRSDGEEFPVEATISQFELADEKLFTIILRDVNDRMQAEQELDKLQQEYVYLQEELKSELGFEEIVGRSEAIQKVLQAVQQVAGTEATVLLTGETGTGKELIARAIHRLSARSRKVLIKVNCAALPAGLIESELFGHEKGAFTGALSRKNGRFELAHNGTLFLDEIGDLPMELQAKLLRVLQEGEYERVGGTETLDVDVRVIAATNRDLTKEVASREFRADLFYRLNVFPIRLPPLRERPDDIPLLVSHFTMRNSAKLGKRIETISEETMQSLMSYSWPGNVRELQNVVERAVILTEGTTLNLGRSMPKTDTPRSTYRIQTLEEVERQHIMAVLEQCHGKVSGRGGAAEVLGMKRTTLEARLKKLGIEKPGR